MQVRETDLIGEVKVFDVTFLVVHVVKFVTKVEISIDGDSRFDAEFPIKASLISSRRIFIDGHIEDLKHALIRYDVRVNARVKFGAAVMQHVNIRVFGNERALPIPAEQRAAVEPGSYAVRSDEPLDGHDARHVFADLFFVRHDFAAPIGLKSASDIWTVNWTLFKLGTLLFRQEEYLVFRHEENVVVVGAGNWPDVEGFVGFRR